MKIDNMHAINLEKNLIACGRSKHMEIRIHYLRETVTNEKLNFEHCGTKNQIADVMKKVVQVGFFKRLRIMMNVGSLDTMTQVVR